MRRPPESAMAPRNGLNTAITMPEAHWVTAQVAWPVTDPCLRQRIIDECLVAYLHDGRDAWDLEADGSYRRVDRTVEGHGAQGALMGRYASHGLSRAAARDACTM